ncbi:hypothetical protein ScPMuIL_000263 [Solemya velum]
MTRRRRAAATEASPQPPKRTRRYNLRSTPSRIKRDLLLGGEQEGRRPLVTDEEHRDKNKVLKPESNTEALKVSSVDLQAEKNRDAHHTEEYEMEGLIVRRGQSFCLSITFDREINKDEDILILQFVFGARPQESKGSVIRIPVKLEADCDSPDILNTWKVTTTTIKEKTATVSVTPPEDSSIGRYEFFVESKLVSKEATDLNRYEHEDNLIMLFNPWCPEDTVYMEDRERDEYVMNETGRIWMGSQRCFFGKPWNFGQFDNPVLECALHLLDRAELGDVARGSIVSVVRTISAQANSCDEDQGILEGRWTETYPKKCTLPWSWTGSVKIIKEFMEKGKSVKYGQCWVFSGLVTTLCRSLGIPTRSVTNFESAHDCDSSMTIDSHYDEDGDPMEDMNDSVWNFHVWNESWFRRLDLPEDYNGWQVHDATPQEVSEGVMRCGPAPLKAVKEGHVYLNYDVAFIFAEVNGDRVQWQCNDDGSMEVTKIDKHSVGKCISTKAVGCPDRHDLTLDYKYPEGTQDERRVVKFVNRFSTRRKENIYHLDLKHEVTFDLVLPEDTLVGDDFKAGLIVTNASSEDKTIRVKLTLVSAYYTGVAGRRVKNETFEYNVNSEDKRQVMMDVDSGEYVKFMNPGAVFQLYASCKVMETKKSFAKQESFFLRKPEMTIEMPEKAEQYEEVKAVIKFHNTTKLKLTGGSLQIEGSGLVTAEEIATKKVIKAGDEIIEEIKVFPTRYGTKELVASFSCDQITDVESSATIYVSRKAGGLDDPTTLSTSERNSFFIGK